MGAHLSVEEKLNAEVELKENRKRIKQLREELNRLKYRNKRLVTFLSARHKSKHQGLFAQNGLCYKMFGKKAKELTQEEKRAYWRVKERQYREEKRAHRLNNLSDRKSIN